jgi:hypothetical protein
MNTWGGGTPSFWCSSYTECHLLITVIIVYIMWCLVLCVSSHIGVIDAIVVHHFMQVEGAYITCSLIDFIIRILLKQT